MAASIEARVTVTLLLFARYAELAGRDSMAVSVAAPATVGDVLRAARASIPGAAALPDRPLCAVNLVHARLDTAVQEGDEIAILPPLAGG